MSRAGMSASGDARAAGGGAGSPNDDARDVADSRPPASGAFAVSLRLHRQAAGMIQEEFAAKAGVGVRTLRDLERGRARPQRATVDLLAAALGLRGPARDEFVRAARRGAAGGPAGAGGPPAEPPPPPPPLGGPAGAGHPAAGPPG